jgi:transcriptional regulator with XRE-family HTH domain
MNTDLLIEALKRLLKTRNVTYAQLARGIGLSEASVKRLFSRRTFTLKRLEQVLQVLEVDFFELARLARGATEARESLTEAQETALAADPRLLGVFYLLYNDWQPAEIVKRYELTLPACVTLVAKLARLDLVDWLPKERVRLRVARPLRLRPDGPIRARHGPRALAEFLSVRCVQLGGHVRCE